MVRALHGRTGILCTAVFLGFAWSANASVISTPDYITDNFDTGSNDLWTVVAGSNAGLAWSNAVPPGNSPLGSPAPGGVNPGYLDVSDKQNKTMVVQAPTAFSGDLSRFIDSTLFFDGFVKQISGGPGTQPQQSFGVVVITGTGPASGLQASFDSAHSIRTPRDMPEFQRS